MILYDQSTTVMVRDLIFLVDEFSDGHYEAKAVGHGIITEADSLDELRAMVRDAVACHFDEAERPTNVRLRIVREEIRAL